VLSHVIKMVGDGKLACDSEPALSSAYRLS